MSEPAPVAQAPAEAAPVAEAPVEAAPVAQAPVEAAHDEPPISMPEHESEAQALTEAALPDESAPEADVDALVEAAAPHQHETNPAPEPSQGEAAP